MKKIMVPLVISMLFGCGCGQADATAIATPALSMPGTPDQPQEPALPLAYRSADRRSPFEPAGVAVGGGLAVQPDFERAQAPLERFALRELRMVGTLTGRGAVRALIRDPHGRIHALRTGDYLGMDHGRIDAVRAAGLDLIEMVRDGNGGWMQRTRVLALSSERALQSGRALSSTPADDGGGDDS